MRRRNRRTAVLAGVAALLAATGAQARNPVFGGPFGSPLVPGKEQGTADPGMFYENGKFTVVATKHWDGAAAITWRTTTATLYPRWESPGYVLTQEPIWAVPNGDYWAPDMVRVNGRLAVYFSARSRRTGNFCIGRALEVPGGRFQPDRKAIACRKAWGYIDPDVFTEDPNSRKIYLLYKRGKDKAIVIRVLHKDGTHPGREHVVTRHDQKWDGGSVEAPTMMYRGGWYYVFFSGATYTRETYGVGVTRSKRPLGRWHKLRQRPAWDRRAPTDKAYGNPILSARFDPDFCGAGHQDVTYLGDQWTMWYAAWPESAATPNKGLSCNPSDRYLMRDPIRWVRKWPHVNDGTPSPGSPAG